MPTADYVASIIEAFAGGLNVFKKLGGKKKKKACARNGGAVESRSSELELRQSLLNAPREIRRVYERNYSQAGLGERYAVGDATAESSLAGTLLKLNAGLVNIISSFLCGGKHAAQLDYASLTSLSNASCTEAIDTLNQLRHRLSRSQLDLLPAHAYGRAAVPAGAHHAKKDDAKKHHRPSDAAKRKPKKSSAAATGGGSTTLPNGTSLRKVPVRTNSAPQLALVRPSSGRRTKSASSSSIGRPKSNISSAGASPSHSRNNSYTSHSPPRYTSSPHHHHHHLPPPFPAPSPVSYHSITPPPSYPQSPVNSSSPSPGETWTYLHPSSAVLYAQPAAAHRSRREVHSFHSDSTRLGEIPMRKWTVPYDAEAMGRANREALATSWNAEAAGLGRAQQGRKGGRLRRLFGG